MGGQQVYVGDEFRPYAATIAFGKHAGKPRCAQSKYRNYHRYQCHSVGKYGPDENGHHWCGIHRAEAFAKREEAKAQFRAERDAELREKLDRRDRQIEARAKVLEVLKQIAKGHSDPRSLAAETLATWGTHL